MKTRVAYICDGKNCPKPVGCKVKNKKKGLCLHTTDPKHAVNGKCRDPWNYPERFEMEKIGNAKFYFEKEE